MKRREEEGDTETYENDILAPFLDKNNMHTKLFDRAEATRIKNEVLSKFKERIVSRADIIDKRIKKERDEVPLTIP